MKCYFCEKNVKRDNEIIAELNLSFNHYTFEDQEICSKCWKRICKLMGKTSFSVEKTERRIQLNQKREEGKH